ncbi:MAG TPA: DinB family protein [Gemmatimonadales bacterium]|nr:DinB family protein [Gemmatimonadales bacterium]
MNVTEVKESFAYNAWANRRLFDALGALPAEQYQRDLKSSFGSIHGTVCHIVWAEQLWLTRWLGKPAPGVAQGKDLAGLADARARWDGLEAERVAFLGAFPDARLSDTITIQPTGGGAYAHTFRQMFLHVVDHSSYHRGQVITMLRQLGVKPPSTGMMGFFRERK